MKQATARLLAGVAGIILWFTRNITPSHYLWRAGAIWDKYHQFFAAFWASKHHTLPTQVFLSTHVCASSAW
jgi:hypothetical protein